MRNYTPNKGTCPVPEGTLVDVIHRDGEVFKRTDGDEWRWSIEGDFPGDIIFWRLSKPKKEKAA